MYVKINNPDNPINRIYPVTIVSCWGQTIDCDLDDLKELQKEIKKVLDKLQKM